MFKFNIIAKLTPSGIADSVNLLNAKGKNYTLYYRLTVLGFSTGWVPVKFLDTFPN